MFEHRLRVMVVPWQDEGFVRRLQEACTAIGRDRLEVSSRKAAERVQAALRQAGYPQAVVEYHPSADDILEGRAAWVVLRDGRTH